MLKFLLQKVLPKIVKVTDRNPNPIVTKVSTRKKRNDPDPGGISGNSRELLDKNRREVRCAD